MATSALATAFVNIVPGTKAMEQYLKGDLSKGAGGAGEKAGAEYGKGFGASFKKLAKGFIGIALAKQVGDFVADSVKSANALYIEFEGVGSVFGKAAGKVQAFAKTAAATAGISESAALAAAKGFGGFATSAGLAADQAAKFSIDLTKAAGDMASFYGGGTEASLGAIKSALMGQYEPMLKYNQQLTEASVRQEAFALKLTSTTNSALTPQQKTLAVQSLLMKGLGVATGDYVKYADTFDNAQQTMKANFEDMKATIGTSLLPVLGQLVAAINPVIKMAGPLLFSVFQKLIPLFELVTDTIGKLQPILTPLVNIFGIFIETGVSTLVTIMPSVISLLLAVMPLFYKMAKVVGDLAVKIMPSLTKILDKVVMPILGFLIDILDKYLLPLFGKTADFLGEVIPIAVDLLVKGFEGLIKILKPVWDFLKPILDGLMSWAGVKPLKISATGGSVMDNYKAQGGVVGTGLGTDLPALDYTGLGGGGVDKSAAAKAKKTAAAIKKIFTATNKSIAKANATYNKAVAAANEKFYNDQTDIAVKFNEQSVEITTKRDEDLAKAESEHAANVLKINADFVQKLADIVQQSKDRLRNAFESVTAVDVGKTFADLGKKNIDTLLKKLKSNLSKAKDLVANTALLAGAGFSQTFIEQVTALGPDAGNSMAKSILKSTPAAQAELQALFAESEKTSAHGMDALANTMYDKNGLATEGLKSLYTQTQADLAAALIAENQAFTDEKANVMKSFNTAMAEAAAERDKALAEAENTLVDALTTASKNLNDSLTTIQNDLTTKLKDFKGQLAGYAKAIKDIKDQIADAKAVANAEIIVPDTTPAATGGTIQMRAMASGGFVTKPTTALIGEAGPEVVTPLKDFERMMGLTNTASNTVNYYAAPNQSLSAEQALFQAMKRAKVVGAW